MEKKSTTFIINPDGYFDFFYLNYLNDHDFKIPFGAFHTQTKDGCLK